MGSKFEEELSCPICGELLKDPVLLSCAHPVCNACLKQFWVDNLAKECPVCRRRSSIDHPLSNLVLKNLCETFSQEEGQGASAGSKGFCSEHNEKLQLFCVQHRRPVCVVCRFSGEHSGHTFKALDDEPINLKMQLKLSLHRLQTKVEDLKEAELATANTTQYIKARVSNMERVIKEKFEELHQFLRDEEGARIRALRQERDEKLRMLQKMTLRMRRQVHTLTEAIKSIEEDMDPNQVVLRQNYRSTVEKPEDTRQNPRTVSEALISKAKNLDDLKLQVVKKMRDSLEKPPLILDLNTAHPDLILSDDLTTVKCVENNPKRFDLYHSVLGSEGYDSGCHCWDVEVGDYPRWILGVMAESASRKGDFTPQVGRWFMWRNDDEYAARCTPKPSTFLKLEDIPHRIRVQLDCDEGKLSFFDADSCTHLHTLTDGFPEKVFPYFNTVFTMKVLPVTSGWISPVQSPVPSDEH